MPLTPTSTNNGIVLTEVATAIAECLRLNSMGSFYLFATVNDGNVGERF
jgi:hypothetical protein